LAANVKREYQTVPDLSDPLRRGVNLAVAMSREFKISIAILFAVIAALGAAFMHAQDTAKPKPVEQSSFDVIGIETRTNNAKEPTGNGEIPKLWQRLFNEGILNNIPDRTDQGITVVYTNYASDWNGDYTYILGAKVKSGTKAPAGMVSVTVPAGKYVAFQSARGTGQMVVPEVWKQIWAYFQEPGSPVRAYKSDFERYETPSDPSSVQANIFMGVKL
jgi:predicted transcriptional regulator YdeE